MKKSTRFNLLKYAFVIAVFFYSCKEESELPGLDTTIPVELERSLEASNLPYELDGLGGAYHPFQIVVQFQPNTSQATINDILINQLGAVSVKNCMCGEVLSVATWTEEALEEGGGLEGIKQRGTSEVEIEELTFNYYNFTDIFQFTTPTIFGNPFYNQTQNENIIAVVDVGVDYGSSTIINGRLEGNALEDETVTDQDGNCLIGDQIGWDFFNEDNDPTDDHGHGTHVANTIIDQLALLDPTGQINEVFTFLPIKTHNDKGVGTLFAVSCGIIYAADRGADVINASWGFYADDEPEVLRKSIEYANETSGAILVTSMGNESLNLDAFNHYPSDFDLDYVIPVGSNDSSNTSKASFSNYYTNQTENLFAPGVDITATMPVWYDTPTETKSGTSMSAAAISAAVAFGISECGTKDPISLLNAIKDGLLVQNETIATNSYNYVNYLPTTYDPCP